MLLVPGSRFQGCFPEFSHWVAPAKMRVDAQKERLEVLKSNLEAYQMHVALADKTYLLCTIQYLCRYLAIWSTYSR